MFGLNLDHYGMIVGLSGVSVLSASSVCMLMSSSCLLPSNLVLTVNSASENRTCPLSLVTRTGLVAGLAAIGTGSSLRVLSLLN